uniref:Plexin-B1 n=1 Tax=Pygocentrus nattereri TaxID=42514 RepID=A0AAR2IK09_PYGNA
MPAAAPHLLPLAIWWWPPILLLLWPQSPLSFGHSLWSAPSYSPQISASLHDSHLNHLLLDSSSGHIYVGAVNALYHLSPDLQLLSWGKTGPKLDSPDCLPPIDPLECTQAKETDNTNKLLLLEEPEEEGGIRSLIVCGTVLQGICEKRSLRNVSDVLYQTPNPVDTQYVAANDPRVSTVGVIVGQKGARLMLVGRGYTSKGPGGIPPITMRRLAPHHSAPAFSHEELGKLVVGSYSEYNNQFVKALHHNKHVYFLFSRRDVWGKREYRTYVSRLCAGDPSFYSYVEVPLACEGGYNLAQAAALGTHLGDPALFVAMAAGQASTPTPTSRSALCVYSMKELDKALQRAQFLCYTAEGRESGNQDEAYIEYEVSSKCLKLPPSSVTEYPCGGEHTPSPIASAVPLNAKPAVTQATQVTAVAVATEAGHTIALLGDKSGQLHKVLNAEATVCVQTCERSAELSPVNADLLLDSTGRNIYVLTERKVTRLPVAQCELHLDCNSCLSVRDPYCGWCSLEDVSMCGYLCHGRCMACVSSVWPCHWCAGDELCTHNHTCPQHLSLSLSLSLTHSLTCSVTHSLTHSLSLLVTLYISISLSLTFFPVSFSVSLLSFPSFFVSFLYNCSIGQSDCSQCRAVSEDYGCVWCGGDTPGCVFNQSCPSAAVDTCPPPLITEVHPLTGPLEGGVLLTILGSNLGQRYQDIQGGVTVAGVACRPLPEAYRISTQIVCELQPTKQVTAGPVLVTVGNSEPGQSPQTFTYQDPQLTRIFPSKGPMAGGTRITVHGSWLLTGQSTDLRAFVGSQPCHIMDGVSDTQLVCRTSHSNQTAGVSVRVLFGRAERTVHNVVFHYLEDPVITGAAPAESFYGYRILIGELQTDFHDCSNCAHHLCVSISSEQMSCQSPSVPKDGRVVRVWFEMDNVHVDFESIKGTPFTYHPNPELYPLNREHPESPIRFKPGGVLAVEGKYLTQAMSKDEVVAWLGDKECDVKTLDDTHLYCEPPEEQPLSMDHEELPSLKVVMGRLEFNLGTVQYDIGNHSTMPLEAQVGLAAGAAVVVLIVLVIILMYRRKSKQAMRDYKKVLVQLETLEINVGDQCRKEFTDLMTEMMDLSSDVGGPCIPFLDYRTYAERIFFPGQRGAPLSQNLDLPESRRQTVEQGLGQLNNLLNNRLFLTRFIHTLEEQQNFSQRDRGYVASLLTMALHDKLEYFTDVMKTLLGDLVQQYVAKNPKLMLRRTETVVEKMLTNWMSICLYSFLKEVAGEPLYMLYRAIKYQVDKGPVDAVTGKAKRTLNDSHLLREDIDYCSMTLTVLVKSGMEVQPCPVKVLDTDTITQVKDKILDQIYKGAPFSQRPSADSLDLEWRSGQAGHLTLSDDDVTAIVQGHWKRLNTLQHYKVSLISPGGALIGSFTPMLEGGEEEGLRLWHLVKSSEEPEIPKHRKSSMRERERAKAIPEIYLTRLLSMKGTLQKFVDDVFVAILSTKRPPPIAVRFFFDFLDDMAEKHGIDDPETVHIWKTNSLPLRFWVNILKNPQFVFDVQVTDSVDAVLSVIAQTFIDSCTTSEHKVGRDSPVNKLLYAREIPRYKQLVERYYSDIHSAASGCYQEMNSMLTELSGMNSLVALHELYKYINKYYDQIIMALEEDAAGQKMQLAYRLQQVAALVENKVTDL